MKYKILVIDDEPIVIEALRLCLQPLSIEVIGAESGEYGLRAAEINKNEIAVILVDYRLPGISGDEVIRKLLKIDPSFDIIGISGLDTDEIYEKMIGQGAVTFISKDLAPERKIALISGYLRKYDSTKRILKVNTQVLHENKNFISSLGLIGQSQNMLDVALRIKQYANIGKPILITGETGTGKEVIARAIHRYSKRAKETFIPVNCGAIPSNLIESELFGSLRGAFTDAKYDKKGAFRAAQKGFIFLDEFGELTPQGQVALLRAIQFKEVKPVGGNEPVKVDVNVIVATNKELKSEVENKRFREDLYFRVNEFQIHLAPLRERLEDIEPLVLFFLEVESKKMDRNFEIRARAIEKLKSYNWPGNVRELESVIGGMVVRATSDVLDGNSVPDRITSKSVSGILNANPKEAFLLSKQKYDAEQKTIIAKGLENFGSIRKLATAMGLNKSTLHSRMQELGIQINKKIKEGITEGEI